MDDTIPSPDTIHAILEEHLGLSADHVSARRFSTGKFNTTLEVDADEHKLVLRIAPPEDAGFIFYEAGMMAQEPEIHDLVRTQTNIPVAEALAYDASGQIMERPYILMERLPGRPLTEATSMSSSAYDHVLFQVGGLLRELYSITREEHGYLGAHRPLPPEVTWPAAFRAMWTKMIQQIGEVGAYSPDEVSHFLDLLARHAHLFDYEGPACLLHMDVWHQNILVDDEFRVTGLVDWDRALWGHPEIELAVLDYCGISKPGFWRGFGADRDGSLEARIRNLFYLLYEVQKYIIIRILRHDDPGGAARYRQTARQLAMEVEALAA